MSVSITGLIWQAKTREEIKTGSEKSEVGMYSTQLPLKSLEILMKLHFLGLPLDVNHLYKFE